MKNELPGVILAGGRSRRFGSNKALSRLGDRTVLEHVIASLHPLCDPITIIAKEREPYLPFGLPVVADTFEASGPIAGLATALQLNRSGLVVVAGCDLPFIKTALLRHLLSLLEDYDAVVPYYPDRFQPLCALYRPGCLPFLMEMMEERKRNLQGLFRKIKTRKIAPQELAPYDPEKVFFNINTPSDLETASRMMKEGSESST